MGNILQDLRFAARTLKKSPGFAIVALATLALGIGANTAIFSVVNAVLLRPLPYHEPNRLFMLWETVPQRQSLRNPLSVPNFVDWRAQSTSFEGMSVYHDTALNWTGVQPAERLRGGRVNANFFSLLGVKPVIGRAFAAGEDQREAARVVMVSEGLWARRFARSASAVGQVLRLDGENYAIVGVAPQWFQFYDEEVDVWVPAVFTQPELTNRGGHFLGAVARLRPGVTQAQAQAELDGIAVRLAAQYSDYNSGRGANIVPLQDELVGDLRRPLFVLLGAVAFVLLIASADVANLMLARATARQREIAVRAALGASRGRVIQQLLTESLLLAAAGGALGLVLNAWALDALVSMIPAGIPRVKEIGVDSMALAFAAGVTLLTGIVFGLAPALLASRTDLNETLKEGGRGSALGRHRLRSALVVVEVALSLVLLIGAGLLLRSFHRLQSVPPGFESDGRITFNVSLPDGRYKESQAWDRFYEKSLAQLAALPGVNSAAVAVNLPVSGIQIRLGTVREDQRSGPRADRAAPQYHAISPQYFRAMGMPLLRGRQFDDRDRRGAPYVAIVSQEFVREFFGNEEPLGKRIFVGYGNDETDNQELAFEIVGVVGNVKHRGPQKADESEVYTPFAQTPWTFGQFVLETPVKPAALAAPIAAAIAAVDKDIPVANVRPLRVLLEQSVAQERFRLLLLGLFAGAALLLAAIGIYGVLSYSVTQRTAEIGVRMALGAQARDVLGLVLGQGIALIGMGVAFGLAGAFLLTRFLERLLFSIKYTDGVTYAGVSLVLIAVALLACYVPARRATKVDPMVALRYE